MSLKTLRKWLIFVAVLIGIFLGVWASLEFILTLEEMQKYSIVFKFWRGIQRGSAFACILLACVWALILLFSIVVAILDKKPQSRRSASTRRNSRQRHSRRRQQVRQSHSKSQVFYLSPDDLKGIDDED